jgi:hypothetical protein
LIGLRVEDVIFSILCLCSRFEVRGFIQSE